MLQKIILQKTPKKSVFLIGQLQRRIKLAQNVLHWKMKTSVPHWTGSSVSPFLSQSVFFRLVPNEHDPGGMKPSNNNHFNVICP